MSEDRFFSDEFFDSNLWMLSLTEGAGHNSLFEHPSPAPATSPVLAPDAVASIDLVKGEMDRFRHHSSDL